MHVAELNDFLLLARFQRVDRAPGGTLALGNLQRMEHALEHRGGGALGLALAQPEREVLAVSGDGSLLMNLGALVTVVGSGVTNFTVILLDNGCYDNGWTADACSAGNRLLRTSARGRICQRRQFPAARGLEC